MMWTDDPYKGYARWDAEQEEALERLPKCCECGEPIVDDYCYYINDEYICEDCLNLCYRVETPESEF